MPSTVQQIIFTENFGPGSIAMPTLHSESEGLERKESMRRDEEIPAACENYDVRLSTENLWCS